MYCSGQFGHLDVMQRELDVLALPVAVRIFGINAAGHEAGNAAITRGRALPWLQDIEEQDAWGRWGVRWRDVRVVDASNELVLVYNLTSHDLGDPANHAHLKWILEDVARRSP